MIGKELVLGNKSWSVWKRAFHIWQITPHQVAPLDEEKHVCSSCATEYQGNFCPRCGQAARVGRFSFKKAFLLFLDIWGIGNRGMFRSIRDLMLRPGYMIRDYVSGMQSAYFPPFKMFFIFATFSTLISHGFNFSLEEQKNEVAPKEISKGIEINGKKIDNKTVIFVKRIPQYMVSLEKKSPAIFSFILLLLESAPLFLFFRRCPAIPDLRYSEHIVALAYTSNMYSIYRIIADIIPFHLLSGLIQLFAVLMTFVAFKQFTGYSYMRLFWYFVLTFIIIIWLVMIAASIFFLIIYLTANT